MTLEDLNIFLCPVKAESVMFIASLSFVIFFFWKAGYQFMSYSYRFNTTTCHFLTLCFVLGIHCLCYSGATATNATGAAVAATTTATTKDTKTKEMHAINLSSVK